MVPHFASQFTLEYARLALSPELPDLERAHTVGTDERDAAGLPSGGHVDLVLELPFGERFQ